MRLCGLGNFPGAKGNTEESVLAGSNSEEGRLLSVTLMGKKTKHLPLSKLTLVLSLSFTLKLHVFRSTEALLIGEMEPS